MTDKEVQIEKILSSEYNCKVTLTHSLVVITNPNETSGAFYVVLKDHDNILDSYCKKDSLFLDSISQIIANTVYSAMNYQKNYNRIDVIFRGPGDCDQLIEVPIKNFLLKFQK